MTQFGESGRARQGSADGLGQVANDTNEDEMWATDARPRVNPFLAALWVIGFTLIVGGLWLYWRAISNQNNSYNGVGEMPFEMLLQQLSWTLSPTMVSTGFLVLVGLIFERAIRWQRERRPTS
ncbi:hypothetical protein GCM10022381_22240 [Leifsonia kafniensis]|uniref:Uncharacterized protein n=1 Tax=Leifsonia kafniensis TaxID=475957 RepID=A0ABP7KLK6_9MICO